MNKEARKAVWRVACETCRTSDKRYHCTWRFKSERGAQNKIAVIRDAEAHKCKIKASTTGEWCSSAYHFLILEHWDGEREKWVKQK